ncbi:site-specific DNA-methyltransferase [Methanimicrococcus hacksteinii]|uniref:site-specific DNA-methyltransferase n=1 Tax=Methanimicrococcus hacksteinii TaxID=3028293 RepID=UPI00298EFF60|nr:site-specific DNA-methyltransferase [Methanimicrococcus sp. At1]
MGDDVADDEAYEFTWVGKKEAVMEAGKPIRKTLRPCPEESKSFDSTENLYIEGDNLDVLKLLQESYLGKVKMIYIDPPYNTGNDFIYRDNFTQSLDEHEEEAGVYDENGDKMFKNTEKNGRFHSDWCSMIYPRLVLARNLLRDDGVIFISIDDNEQENLKKICDEVFGNNNFINTIVVKMSELSGLKMKHLKKFPKTKEYLLIYGKNRFNTDLEIPKTTKVNDDLSNYLKYYSNVIENLEDVPEKWNIIPLKDYFKKNNIQCSDDEIDQWKLKNAARTVYRTNSVTITNFLKKNPGAPSVCALINNDGNEVIKWDDKEMLFLSKYLESYMGDLWLDLSTINLNKELLLEKGFFENGQKPLSLLERILKTSITDNDIVLDFFSGSATTAHAVMQLNAEDGGNRQFILVQLPEIDESSEAYAAGYNTVCEIGKERIRRAGEKIKEENKDKENIESLDIGFRVLKLDDSNMKDVYYAAGAYTQDLLSLTESNIKDDRNDMDLLYGCLLDWGLPLSQSHKTEEIDGVTVHTYNDGDLMACFADKVSEAVVKEIAKRQPLRVVFRDSSFSSSPEKINVEEIFKLMAPNTTVKVI